MTWPFTTGPMADRIRSFPWGETPLGAMKHWPPPLHCAVEQMLATELVASVVAGPERVFLYNDASARQYGDRHPAALGRTIAASWPEGWAATSIFYDRVFAGEAVSVPAHPLDLARPGSGQVFDAHLTPVRDADGGVIAAAMIGFEVGARLRAEAALRDSEQQLRALFENMDQGFCIIEKVATPPAAPVDFRYRRVNLAFERHTGLADVVGKTIRQVVSPPAEVMSLYDRVALDGVHDRFEAYVPALDRWIEAEALPGPSEGQVAVLFTDITERRATEAKLKASEERQAFLLALSDALRPLTDAAEITATACRLLGRRLLASRAYYVEWPAGERHCEVARDYAAPGVQSLAGRRPIDALRSTYDRIAAGRTWIMEDATAATDVGSAERESHGGMGTTAWIDVPLIKGGQVEAALCLVDEHARRWTGAEIAMVEGTAERIRGAVERGRAETAMRESQRLQAAMLEVLPLGLAVVAPDGRVALSNTHWLRFAPTGRVPSQDMERVARWRAWDAAGRPLAPSDFPAARALRGEAVLPGIDFLFRGDTGAEVWTRVAAVPITGEDGRVGGAVSIIDDVDTVKRADIALRAAEEQRRVALEGGRMGAWRWDVARGLVWGDAAFLALWGFSPSDAPRPLEAFTARLTLEGQEQVARVVEKVIAADEGFEGDLQIVEGPTKGCWVRWRGRAHAERTSLIHGVAFDVTENRFARERQRFLPALSAALSALTDERAIQEAACRALAKHLGVDRVQYSVVDLASGGLVNAIEHHEGDVPSIAGRYDLAQFPVHVDAWTAGRSVAVNDVRADPRLGEGERAAMLAAGVEAALSVPQVMDGRPVAVLSALSAKPHHWRPESEPLLRDVADRTWHAVERARAETALKESEARFSQFAASSSDALWVRTAEGLTMEYVSPAIAPIYGVPPDALVGGPERWTALILPTDREAAMQHLAQARAGEAVVHEFRIRRASDGQTRWIRDTDFPLRDADGRVQRIGGIARDVTDEKRSVERQQLLLAELQHRVRNILAVVRSVFNRTVEANGDVDEVADHFRGRLDSLARTQVVATGTVVGAVDLENLIRDELLSVGVSDGPKLTIEGPDVVLPATMAESVGLAIHELTTNALKYGAIKTGNHLKIVWTVNLDHSKGQRLDLLWAEQGVPAISVRPSRQGFGTELITEALPYRLGAETSLEFRGGGVRCLISLPLPDEGASAAQTWEGV